MAVKRTMLLAGGREVFAARGSMAFDHAHAPYVKILRRCVRTRRMDYATLKKDPATLSAYLNGTARVLLTDFNVWLPS